MRAVVIVANGWNAGWLGCYGNEWAQTVNLDRLAAESVVFDQHFATNPVPNEYLRSHAAGRYVDPAAIGVQFAGANLFRLLRRHGIRTVRVRDLDAPGPVRGEDEWDETAAVPRSPEISRGEALFGVAARKLEELAGVDDWLLWVETDRLLPPWTVSPDFFEEYAQDMVLGEEEQAALPEPWCIPPAGKAELSGGEYELLHGTFAAVISEWDAELGEWFDLFRELGFDRSALWAVTSGHGLSLGEHDWIGPDAERLHEELVHIPLLLRLPGAAEAGRRVASMTQSIDLLPTLLDAFGRPAPDAIQGQSLLPLTASAGTSRIQWSWQGLYAGNRMEWALRTPEWACLLSSGNELPPMLFRKPEDRWEVNDVRQQHLEWAEYLESARREIERSAHDPGIALPELKRYDEIIEPPSVVPEEDQDDGPDEES